jgi:hypothetical protein
MEFGQNGEYSQKFHHNHQGKNPDTIRENNFVLYSQVIMGCFKKNSLSALVNMAGFFFNESPSQASKVFKMNSSKFSPSAALFCRLLIVGIMSDEQIGNPLNCVMQRERRGE